MSAVIKNIDIEIRINRPSYPPIQILTKGDGGPIHWEDTIRIALEACGYTPKAADSVVASAELPESTLTEA